MKFRKKPVEVEAWLCSEVYEAFKRDGWESMPEPIIKEQDTNGYWLVTTEHGEHGRGIYIPTLEGSMFAQLDDYIIQGVQGEFYPCKPDIFEATYEKVNS